MLPKIDTKIIIFLFSLGLLVIGFSIWWGGLATWKLLGFDASKDSSQENLAALEEILADNPNETYSKYNLAVVYYRQQNYQKALDQLKALLNSTEIDSNQLGNIHYNLGNSLYRLSEQQKDIAESIKLLEQCLLHYRTVIDREEQKSKHSSIPIEKDEDARFNYVLARTKLKLLNDELQKQKDKQEKEKPIYQLLKELREKEKMILDQLGTMKNDPFSKQSITQREELLKMRKKNFEQLHIIEGKLLQSFTQQPP